jgi:hypothetical protein
MLRLRTDGPCMPNLPASLLKKPTIFFVSRCQAQSQFQRRRSSCWEIRIGQKCCALVIIAKFSLNLHPFFCPPVGDGSVWRHSVCLNRRPLGQIHGRRPIVPLQSHVRIPRSRLAYCFTCRAATRLPVPGSKPATAPGRCPGVLDRDYRPNWLPAGNQLCTILDTDFRERRY